MLTDLAQSRRSADPRATRPCDSGQSSPAPSSSRREVVALTWSSVVCQATSACCDHTGWSSRRTCVMHVSYTQLAYDLALAQTSPSVRISRWLAHEIIAGQFGYNGGCRCPEWPFRVRALQFGALPGGKPDCANTTHASDRLPLRMPLHRLIALARLGSDKGLVQGIAGYAQNLTPEAAGSFPAKSHLHSRASAHTFRGQIFSRGPASQPLRAERQLA